MPHLHSNFLSLLNLFCTILASCIIAVIKSILSFLVILVIALGTRSFLYHEHDSDPYYKIFKCSQLGGGMCSLILKPKPLCFYYLFTVIVLPLSQGQRMSYLFHILNSLFFCVNIYYSLTKEYDEINKVRL